MNIPLLRKIQRHIKKHPKSFYMDDYGVQLLNQKREPCGTACCIAGEALVKSGAVLKDSSFDPDFDTWDDVRSLEFYAAGPLRKQLRALAKVNPPEDDYTEPAILDDKIGKLQRLYAEEAGRLVLGLTDQQALALFFVHNWPTEFADAYVSRKTLQAKANVAVRRIDHFIKTKGEE